MIFTFVEFDACQLVSAAENKPRISQIRTEKEGQRTLHIIATECPKFFECLYITVYRTPGENKISYRMH